MYKKISAIILILIAFYFTIDKTSNKRNQELTDSRHKIGSNNYLPVNKENTSSIKRGKLPTYELHKFMSECPILDRDSLSEYPEIPIKSFEINIPPNKEYFILYKNEDGQLKKINSFYLIKIPIGKLGEAEINNTIMMKCIVLITGWPTGYKPTKEKSNEISEKTSYDVKPYQIFLPLDICPPGIIK